MTDTESTSSTRDEGSQNATGWRHWSNPYVYLPAFAGAFVVMQLLGNAFYFAEESVSSFWPSSGLAMATLLISTPRRWPALIAVIVIVQLTTETGIYNRPLYYTMFLLLPICTETLIAASVLRYLFKPEFRVWEIRHFLSFVGVGVVGATFTGALVGATAVNLFYPAVSFSEVFQVWWFGDALGMLIMAPPLLAWVGFLRGQPDRFSRIRRQGWEIALWSICLLGAALVSSQGARGGGTAIIEFPYFAIPFLVWGAIRFDLRIVATGLLAASCILVANTVMGHGPFADPGLALRERVLELQAFLAVTSIMVIILTIQVERNAQRTAALARSEERFRSIFEHVGVGCIVVDHAGTIEMFNPIAERMFGYAHRELLGAEVHRLFPASERELIDDTIRRSPTNREGAPAIPADRQIIGLRRNGETFPAQFGIGEMRLGDRRAFVLSVADLSEIKSLEVRLMQSQRMEAVGQLTGGVAHDFNNVMATILGNAEMLRDEVPRDGIAARMVDAIARAVARGSSLTQRLLAFSRQQTLSPVVADIVAVIDDLHEVLQRTLGATIDLRIGHASRIWPAYVDRSQFETALVNLALNARDAMPDGGAFHVETSNVTLDQPYADRHEDVPPGDYVLVTVSDNGAGMSKEVLDRVFEPFFTTKEVGKGTGLGLSMVYGFVRQSGGHVTICSEVGHGTTAKLYLPRSTEDLPADDRSRVSEGPETATGRILVVEDDEEVRWVAVTILRAQGYEVYEAADGPQAIEVFRLNRPLDLLFTDVVLPGAMNGIAVAEEAMRLQPTLRVLYASGYTESAVAHNGTLDRGAVMLNKPYRRDALLAAVADLISGKATNSGPSQ